MNLLKKLWQRILAYKRDPGVSDVPDAPDVSAVGRANFDQLVIEQEIQKSGGKKEK